MKNIVKVLRHKDNARRLYQLPNGVTVTRGTLVTVEYPDSFNTCVGTAVSDSYVVDDAGEKMVADLHHIPCGTLEMLKKVVSVYEEHVLDWPADDQDVDEEEAE